MTVITVIHNFATKVTMIAKHPLPQSQTQNHKFHRCLNSVFFILTFQSTFRVSDAAISILLSFLSTFLSILVQGCEVDEDLQSFIKELPTNIIAARKLTGGNRDNFEKFTCCPSCFSIYPWKSNALNNAQQQCMHFEFPNHPQHWNRKLCGMQLMKVVKTAKQAALHYPRLIYCYKPILQSLQEFLLCPNFIQKCEIWRQKDMADDVYNDVYDGDVWKEFQEYEGKPFLSLPYNFAFHLVPTLQTYPTC